MEIDLNKIVDELNFLSAGYRVGNLQQLRRKIQCKSGNYRGMRLQVPKNKHDYAFHWGGRKELQFNLGIEHSHIRYGLAFSFESSRTYPLAELRRLLFPKVGRYNQYIERNADRFANMKMWDWVDDQRSNDYQPGPIRTDLYHGKVFIFLGRSSTRDSWNPHEVLKTFDDLLPIYEYVESDGSSSLKPHRHGAAGFSFQPGCTNKPSRTIAKLHPGISNIRLRHNDMQFTLHAKLASKHGKGNVGTENPSGNGLPIDVVVEHEDNTYSFYEIKTSHDPRICIREAMGQLLEYAYWNGCGPGIRNLVIVGPNPIDYDAQKYLLELRAKFSLPIKYVHLRIPG